jgi:hypothetical protein
LLGSFSLSVFSLLAAAKLAFCSSFSSDSGRLFSPASGPFFFKILRNGGPKRRNIEYIDSKSKNKRKAMEDGRCGTLCVEMAGFYFGSGLSSFVLFTRRRAVFPSKSSAIAKQKRRIISKQEQRQGQRHRGRRYGRSYVEYLAFLFRISVELS